MKAPGSNNPLPGSSPRPQGNMCDRSIPGPNRTFIKVLLLIIGSVFASTHIPLEAILYQNVNNIATFQSHLNKDIGDSRFKLSLTHQQGFFTLKFTLGSGRVFGSNAEMSDKLVFRPISNSPLIGIVELIIEELPYVLAIFLEKSQQGHKEIPSASGRTYEEIITPKLTSRNADIHSTSELLFYYEFLVPINVGSHAVSVQIEATLPLSIRSLNIRVIEEKDSKDEMEMIRASFAGQGSVCQIKDVLTRFVRFEGNSFYFESDDADTGSKWLIALSTALRVWSETGLPESSAIGGLRRHDQMVQYDHIAIRTVIENVFEFQKVQYFLIRLLF